MNNAWVKFSDRSKNDIFMVNDHEDWLDYLNMYETSWILFVWNRRNLESDDFGWPGGQHE